MMNLNKLVLNTSLILLGFVMSFVFITTTVSAATCTAVTGNWSATTTWSGCGGVAPTADDDVIIPSGAVVTVNDLSFAKSVTINNAGVVTGITFSGTTSLQVIGGAIIMNAPTVDGVSTIAIGDGNLYAGSLSIVGGADSKISAVTVASGVLDISGNISFSGTAANARFTMGGNYMTLGGNLGSGGTFNGGTASIILGGTGAQSIAAYTTYSKILVTNTGGTVTMSNGVTTIADTLTLNANSTLDTGESTLSVGGITWVKNGADFLVTSTAGSKTFTGNVNIDTGGTWNETVGENISFGGNLTNNGTFTASTTSTYTFTGAGKTIGGDNPITVAYLGINATTTNTGTTTVSLGIVGAETLINNGTLNIGGTIISGLNADAFENTVNYSKAGAQTVKLMDYYNLTLSGSGTKTISNGVGVMNTLSIASGVVADLTNNPDYSTVYSLYFNNVGQIEGVWGATGSGAVNINDVYLSGTGTVQTSDTIPPTFTASRTSVNTVVLTFNEPINASADTDAWTVAGASAATSSAAVSTTTMTLTTTGLTATDGTVEVNYVQANGNVYDEAFVPNELVDGGAVDASDQVPPTVVITLSDAALTYGETSTVTFTFSEEPTGFANADVTVANGTLSTVTVDGGNPKIYTATLTPSASVVDETNIITLGVGWTDSSVATNAPAGTNDSPNYTINTTAPAGSGNTGSSGSSGGGGYYPYFNLTSTATAVCTTGHIFSVVTGKRCTSWSNNGTSSLNSFKFAKTLKKGITSDYVKELQDKLRAEGFYTHPYSTRFFGGVTFNAVKKYQKAHQLPSTGFVGPLTIIELNK